MIWIIGSTIHYNNVKMNEATSRQKNEKSIVLPCSHTLGRLQVQLLFEGLGIMFVNSWCDRKRTGSGDEAVSRSCRSNDCNHS